MEYNRHRDHSGKIHRSREPNHIPFNLNNIWQENSSQSNEHNGITLYNQQKHTNCWILRSHSGAVQVYQTSAHGNSQYDSWRWPRSGYLTDRATQNKQTRPAKQHFLVSDTRKSWQHRRSYPDSNTNPNKTPWISKKRKTKPERQHWITNGILKKIWLGRHTAHGNWETSSWRHSSWISWFIC